MRMACRTSVWNDESFRGHAWRKLIRMAQVMLHRRIRRPSLLGWSRRMLLAIPVLARRSPRKTRRFEFQRKAAIMVSLSHHHRKPWATAFPFFACTSLCLPLRGGSYKRDGQVSPLRRHKVRQTPNQSSTATVGEDAVRGSRDTDWRDKRYKLYNADSRKTWRRPARVRSIQPRRKRILDGKLHRTMRTRKKNITRDPEVDENFLGRYLTA